MKLLAKSALILSIVGIGLALGVPAFGAEKAADPWSLLEEVRGKLGEGGIKQAEFVQTYVPAGFSKGEEESGKLTLGLPDCLRWDYGEPYPKSFLVCGEEVHYWNPADGTGRRQRIDRESQPGLDLLLLPTAELDARYTARISGEAGGLVSLLLAPRDDRIDVQEATLKLDRGAGQVSELSFRDREGNLTRFRLGDYVAVRAPGRFQPPAEITWLDEPESR